MMKFLKHNILIIKWLYSIGKKFLKNVPKNTSIVIFFHLISDISILIAFLLPIKIILLLGSQNIPKYFPDLLKSLDKEQLVFLLTFISILFYILFVVSSHIILKYTKKGSKNLLHKSDKIALFDNQDLLAFQAFQRYTRVVASIIFIILSLSFIGYFYLEISLILSIYIIIIWLFFSLLFEYFHNTYQQIVININNMLKFISAIAFLLVFIFIIIDFLYIDNKSIIIALISLILSRQITSHFTKIIMDINYLYTNIATINALFYHAHTLSSTTFNKNKTFWNLCKEEQREEWINDIFYNNLKIPSTYKVKSSWYDIEHHDILGFEVVIYNEKDVIQDCFLLKVFNKNRLKMAINERSIIFSIKNLPSLELVNFSKLGELECHIFRSNGLHKIDQRETSTKMIEIKKTLMSLIIPNEFLEKYKRSHSLIWQRLDQNLITQLNLAVDNKNLIKEFEAYLPIIEEVLSNLPLGLTNNLTYSYNLISDHTDQPLLLNWGIYNIETIGSGWKIDKKNMKILKETIVELQESCSKFENVKIKDVKLAAFVYELERLYKKQLYAQAIDIIPNIIRLVKTK